MITVFNQSLVRQIWIIFLMVGAPLFFSHLSAQATVSLTVTDGNATTTCEDFFSGADPYWAVNTASEGWEHYWDNFFCQNTLPNIQFSQQINCLSDLPSINVCFKAYENDGLFCNINEKCPTEICEEFIVPYSGSIEYTLALPDDQPSGGFVIFTIQTDGMLIDQGNDNMCGAIDLGTLNGGQQLGDATQDVYNNYCSDGADEPSTIADGAGWQNNFSVWFTFTTSGDPGSIISILGLSDPQNSGEFLNLQMALYQSSTIDCTGDFELVTSSWNSADLDELMAVNCLEPNRTYYILVDGFITPPTTRLHGLFGLQVNDESIKEAPDQICDASDLGVIPFEGQVTTGLTVSNICATGESTDPQNSLFSADNSVWFTFQAPDSRHVIITAVSDQNREDGGLDAVDIQLAVFASDDETCSGNFTEIESGYDAEILDENLELSCLNPGENYYVLLNGGPLDRGGVFSLTIADAGDNLIVETIDPVICFGDTLTVGSTDFTIAGPISVSLITASGCDSLVAGTLTILPEYQMSQDPVICQGDDFVVGENITYNTSGNYTDVLISMTGCDSTVFTNLTLNPPVTISVMLTVEASAYQVADGTATVTGNGGDGNYTYQWNNSADTQVVTNLVGGSTYCVTVTDGAGCQAMDCIVVLFPSDIQVNIEDDMLSCFGDTDGSLSLAIFNGVVPYEFTWMNAENGLNGTGVITVEGGSATIENLSAGTYDFIITDAFGTTNTTATVIESQPIITNVNETICFGDSLRVGNVFYKNSGPILEILTNQFGCDSILAGNLTILPEITTTIDPSVCFGESFEIGNSNLQDTGNFTEVLTAQNGCDSTVFINLTVLGNLTVNGNLDSEASGLGQADGSASTTVTGGSGNVTYQWSNGSTDPVVANLTGGQTYCVTVTDLDANCTAEDCVVILFPVNILTEFSSDPLDCFGANDGRISFVVSNGQAPYNFSWIGDNGTSGSGVVTTEGGTGVIENLTAGNYIITVSDIWGETTVSANIQQPELLVIDEVNNGAASCFGNCDGNLEIQITGGTAPYDFNWSNGQNTAVINGRCAGPHQVTVTDANNCTEMQTYTIIQPIEFIVQVVNSQSVMCLGAANGQAVITTNGSPVSYLWDNGETGEEALNLSAGLHQVTVTNMDGCITVTEVFVDAPNSPLEAEILILQPISCSDASDGIIGVQVSGAVGNLSYEWSTGGTGTELQNIASGLYEITITDANDCTATAAVELTTADPVIPLFSVQDITCFTGDSQGAILVDTVIGGVPPFLFSLNPEQGFSTTQYFGLLEAGSYDLYVEEVTGCRTGFSFTVAAPDELTVFLGEDKTIALGEETDVLAISNSNHIIFEWEALDTAICAGCEGFTITPFFTQLYRVTATDTLTNCKAYDEQLITVEKLRKVYIPNSFSPNGDGLNDLFTVATGEDVERIISLKIYNRWGAQVYGIEDVQPGTFFGWTGNDGRKNSENGIYIYVSEILFKDEFKQMYRGDLTLFR